MADDIVTQSALQTYKGVAFVVVTATLFYFAWRARRGWRWAYLRLRLFAQIFPVITLVMAAIPGLYPVWMVTEQIVFSLIMIGIADFLTSDHMRAVFANERSVRFIVLAQQDVGLGPGLEQRAVVGEGARERGNDADLDGLGSDAAHGERGSECADQLPLKTHGCLLGWCLRSGRRS